MKYFYVCMGVAALSLILIFSAKVIIGGEQKPVKTYPSRGGDLVPNPTKASADYKAVAKCKDGYYSYSTNRSGACAKHGGVEKWL